MEPHPFLGRSAVANDLVLDDRVRVCFITGPNMAGKSTFLKATAVAVLLAHAGFGVPARSLEFVPVGTVFSSVQIVDNLTAGESFYLAEVRRIGALAAALADHGSALAVIDEPFRGTNVHDAAEATLAVVTRLAARPAATGVLTARNSTNEPNPLGQDDCPPEAGKSNRDQRGGGLTCFDASGGASLVLVASHVGEVTSTILGDPRIALRCFAADVTGDQPRFDYCLRDGVSEQRLGMTLLRQEGVLDRLEQSRDQQIDLQIARSTD